MLLSFLRSLNNKGLKMLTDRGPTKTPILLCSSPAMVLKCVVLTWNIPVFQVTLCLFLAICLCFVHLF